MNYQNVTPRNVRFGNRRAIGFFAVYFALFALLFGLAPSVSAQQVYQAPTTVELEEFRQDFDRVIQEIYQYREMLRQNRVVRETLAKNSKFNSAPALAQVRQQLQEMNYEELAVLHKAFTAQFPEWREASQELGKIAKKISRTSEQSITPDAITPDNCQDAFDAAPSWTDWSAAKAAAIAADGLQNVIPPPLNFVATGVYIAAEEGALVAETLNNIFDRCSGNQDVADIKTAISNVQTSANTIISNNNTNTTSILNSISSATTTITNNDNTNKTMLTTSITNAKNDIVNNDNSNTTNITTAISNAQTNINNTSNSNTTAITTAITTAQNAIIANDNANKNAIVANANANATALTNLILRSQIEADLATESNGVKVAWYMTPTANGGHLDLVQQIVTQTLANIQAAGGSIGNAQSFLNQANADKAAGNFKSAYDNYRKAYKAAAN